jgi:anaerobic magnesium-protoporphyrin IX monomethyl ester cyclase
MVTNQGRMWLKVKTKIILAFPPFVQYSGYGQPKRWLPLGITYIGACLDSYFKKEIKNGSLEVILLDLFDYNFGTSVDLIKSFVNPDEKVIVGFTCLTEQRMSVFIMARLLKQAIPDVQIAIGGPHATLMYEQIAQTYKDVDYILLGEGEGTFADLTWGLLNASEHDGFINGIPGLIVTKNPPVKIPRYTIKDISSLPHAINGLKLFRNIDHSLEAEAPIIFSRGCTASCRFCSTTKFWKGYRSRTADDVFSEMLEWHYIYGANSFKFHDDASTANMEEWKKLCHMMLNHKVSSALIKSGLWKYEITARADQVDDELIELLYRTGCKRVAFGFESGSTDILKSMNKRIDLDLAVSNLQKVKAKGIETVMLLVVGFPGETDETIEQTCNLIRRTKPTMVSPMPLMVFPGTLIYEKCKASGWIDDSYWLQDKPQPYYTKEVPYSKLSEWAGRINEANKL